MERFSSDFVGSHKCTFVDTRYSHSIEIVRTRYHDCNFYVVMFLRTQKLAHLYSKCSLYAYTPCIEPTTINFNLLKNSLPFNPIILIIKLINSSHSTHTHINGCNESSTPFYFHIIQQQINA